MAKNKQSRPWENVAFQLGKGRKSVESDPSKPPVAKVDAGGQPYDAETGELLPDQGVGFYEPEGSLTEAVEAPGINEATPDEMAAEQRKADKQRGRKAAYVRKTPEKPVLETRVQDDVADDRSSDYDQLMEARAKYGKSGFYHWQCPSDHVCWHYRGNRTTCPECGLDRKGLLAIYGQERVTAGSFEPYRGIQTWAQSANRQMTALASRLLRERDGATVQSEVEQVSDGKPSKYYLEYEDADLYQAEMERVGGDESKVDTKRTMRVVDAPNPAVARAKLSKVLRENPDADARIVERRELHQNGNGKWVYQPFIIED